MTTVSVIVNRATQTLTSHSETPRLDAELLVCDVIEQPRVQLFSHPERELTSAEEKQLKKYIKRRMAGEPVAYLVGYKEFWSLRIMVTPDVLIPRPETELLVEWALENLPEQPLRVADLGTGSGAIAIALAHERPNWVIDATDHSKKALKIAKRNAAWHRTTNIHFYHGQWCQALPDKNYHAILGNPPYIASDDDHLKQLKYEPAAALHGGEDGLEAIRIIIEEAKTYLSESGWLVLEHGYDQRKKIIETMEKNNYKNIEDYVDLAGLPRMVVGQRR